MKVLILSCNTGQGHNTAGNAIVEEMKSRNIECKMVDALSFASEKTSRFISQTYIKMAKNTPPVFGFVYRASEAISSDKRKSIVYLANMAYANNLCNYINKYGYDTVITTHVFPAEAITYLKKHKRINVKSFAVTTDYTCSPFWEETSMDYYFVAHNDLIPEFIEKGIKEEKLVTTGIPVSKRFTVKSSKADARKYFGFGENDKIFLIMSGSMGAGKVEELVKNLISECKNNDKILVLCGNNNKLKEKLRKAYPESNHLVALDYTTEVDKYMDACDVLFTKPGGLTSTEAAVKNVPLVHTDPIPGCETMNIEFFTKRGLSIYYEDFDELIKEALELAKNEEKQKAMTEAQHKNIIHNPAGKVCDFILKT